MLVTTGSNEVSSATPTPTHPAHHLDSPTIRPPSRAPSILDSPTLARVERARLRLEAASSQQQLHQHGNGGCSGGGGGSSSGSASNATTINREDSLERSILDPKVCTNGYISAKMWQRHKLIKLSLLFELKF